MAWLEITIDTAAAQVEQVAEELTKRGFSDLVIEDQQEFETFLEENRAYWDYIDEGLQKKLQGLSHIKLYLEDADAKNLRRVQDYAASAGLKAVMTADTHVRCTTRTAEAMLKIEEMTGQRADIVVMVQGDEPMITPDMIDAAVEPMLKDPSINVVNLMADLATEEEFEDPNEVKVVTDLNGDALYFSREPIPSRRKGTPHVPMHKQVCIIPFRRDYLLKFNAMDECPLEIIESVDMMRILEHGEKVRMVPTDKRTLSVDTQEDLERVREMMKDDALRISYTK